MLFGLLPAKAFLERFRVQVQRVGEDGEGQVDRGRDGALQYFVRLSDINDVSVLLARQSRKNINSRCKAYWSRLLRLRFQLLISEFLCIPVSLQVILCL